MPSQLDLLTTKKFDSWFNHIIRIGFSVLVKVQLFWEGHKNLLSKCHNHKEDGANFCGFLRKAELYRPGGKCMAHCPKIKIKGNKLKKCKFHFPELLQTSPMLKKVW